MKLPTTAILKEEIEQKLRLYFSCTAAEARDKDLFSACAMVLRDYLAVRLEPDPGAPAAVQQCPAVTPTREVHYMSLEFLIGRSFRNNAYNLGL